MSKYCECWLRPRCGRVTALKAKFIVKGPPVKQKIRMLPEALKKELESQLEAMLAAGAIRPSKSPWGSAPVFVKKKATGEWRLCLDYRQVNKRMTPDAYPLPLVWENLQIAAHHRYYSCLDCQWGFWNVPLEEESKPFTAIVTHKGTFEFNVIPFGIKNSPGEFQRAMDTIFGDLYSKGVLCYIDDLVIYANSKNEHDTLLEDVLRRCTEGGLYLKLKKSAFLQPEVSLLGHRVGLEGIRPDDAKVAAIQQARAPRSKEELRSFLGTASYLRRFVPCYSELSAKLDDLLRKNVPFVWETVHEEAFERLKAEICDQVLLGAPRGIGPMIIVADASTRAVGCALLQIQEGEPVLLEFGAKKFTKAEEKWDTREREAYAVKWSLEKFHDYVKASRVIVITDHESLRWMDKASSGKVQRWALYIQQYDVQIVHVAGKHNVIADWLSRSVPDDEEDAEIERIGVPCLPAAEEKISPKLFAPYVPREHQFKQGYQSMPAADSRLTFEGPDGMRYGLRTGKLYVPPGLRETILYWFHASRYGGHCGANRTLRRVANWVWWPGMASDVRKFVGGCLICARHAPTQARTLRGLLEKPRPLQLISLDHVGPREWNGEMKYYLVCIDHATRFVVAVTLDEVSATSTRKALEERWINIFQAPDGILTDRGAVFREKRFQEYITQELCAYHVFSSAYYPQGNGINEASHKGLEASIAAVAELRGEHFDRVLQDAVAVHNATPHSALGESPFKAMFGFEPTLPGWQRYRVSDDSATLAASRAERSHRMMMRARLAAERLRLDKDEEVSMGDVVVHQLSNYERSRSRPAGSSSEAYSPKWSLPCRVTAVRAGVVECEPVGCPGARRQVPKSQLKILKGAVPECLVRLNLSLIERENPRFPKPFIMQRPTCATAIPWKELLREEEESAKTKKAKIEEENQLRPGGLDG